MKCWLGQRVRCRENDGVSRSMKIKVQKGRVKRPFRSDDCRERDVMNKSNTMDSRERNTPLYTLLSPTSTPPSPLSLPRTSPNIGEQTDSTHRSLTPGSLKGKTRGIRNPPCCPRAQCIPQGVSGPPAGPGLVPLCEWIEFCSRGLGLEGRPSSHPGCALGETETRMRGA